MSDFPRYDPAPPVRARSESRSRPAVGWLLAGALLGGVAGGAVGVGLAGRTDGPAGVLPPISLPTATPATGGAPSQGGRDVSVVAREAGPSVVTVVQRTASGRTSGSGSGFVIDAQRGYVATNDHVVVGPGGTVASRIDVIFSDATTVTARLVGRDEETDVAVLQIPTAGRSLQALVLGNSDEVPIGAQVVAIGSALGEFTNSVTSGVLSGKGRRLLADEQRQLFLEDLVQTDAAISPGNSGGPLIWAANGQVIGMNTLVVRPPGAEGLGFAVSSNTVRQIAEELIDNGVVERGRIGIAYAVITPRAAAALGLPSNLTGVLIEEVQAGSPAQAAGLRVGDVVTEVNGESIDAEHPLPTIMLRFRAGERVRLTVFRDGSEQQIEVTLGGR